MQLAALPATLEQYERDHKVTVSVLFHSDGSGTFVIYNAHADKQAIEDAQDEMLEDALDELDEMTEEEIDDLEEELGEELEFDDATDLLEEPTLHSTTYKVHFDSIRELGGLLILPPEMGDHTLN